MTEERPRVWVGDQVYDTDAGREGIVTDVTGGTYVIGPVYMWAATWTAPSDEKLEVVLSREERLKRQREQGW
ncbi:hypothetical protein OG824_04345 [Streptomyces prunicolor]|uniref:hypothetical protein n=1 Tax=Streptomyces prunicolor TaxID=67348 RepID=UPI00224F079B|nr:hypothetical protein [Streptomyces prunicolor]MCX5234464.1 hypothetical protein [Streptomyces prunicolor]